MLSHRFCNCLSLQHHLFDLSINTHKSLPFFTLLENPIYLFCLCVPQHWVGFTETHTTSLFGPTYNLKSQIGSKNHWSDSLYFFIGFLFHSLKKPGHIFCFSYKTPTGLPYPHSPLMMYFLISLKYSYNLKKTTSNSFHHI